MSSNLALLVSNVEKSYRLYRRPVDRVFEALALSKRLFHTEFRALDGIGFEIERGETVGLIGPNGSGKSTLLEILCGTLTPTRGTVEVFGTIGGLLELGAGFNPEFTGRENVYLNATIFGLSKNSIDEKIDDIQAFADIGDFIDRPVKTYSNGMYVRLAFAAMIGVDPDILVIDEALSVGDVRFQRKCYRHFQHLQSKGTTILFVTHAVELIRTHCTRAIQLDKGRIVSIGSPKIVVQSYLESMFLPTEEDHSAKGLINTDNKKDTNIAPQLKNPTYNPAEYRWGDGRARIVEYSITSNGNEEPTVFMPGALVEIRARIEFYDALKDVIYGVTLRTLDGATVFGSNTRNRNIITKERSAGDSAELHFCFQLNVLPGDYFVSLGVALDDDQFDQVAIDRRYDMMHIKVVGDGQDFGLADLQMSIAETV